MTRITLTKAIGGHQAGDTINTSPGSAQILTKAGAAKAVEPKPKKKIDKGGDDSPAPQPPKPLG